MRLGESGRFLVLLTTAAISRPAAFDSFRAASSISFHLLESSAIRLELGLLASQLLPALDHDVNILRVKLKSVTDTFGQFSAGKRGAASGSNTSSPRFR